MADLNSLMEALKAGDATAAAAALDASPDLARARDTKGVSVICLAMYMGQRELAALLARGRSDLDLFEASTLGLVDRVQALVSASPGLKDAFSPDGFHPLGYACFFGHRWLFDYLIAAGADVNAPSRNDLQVCPLHSAAATSDPELAVYMAQVLIDKGADVNARQQRGFTPLQEAGQRGHAELIDVLLAAGADKSLRNDEGNNAVGLACMAGYHHLAFKLAPGPIW
jgi:uncharacterized protein